MRITFDLPLKCCWVRVFRIGQAFNDRGEHVRFVAWRGNADERIRRAERVLEEAQEQDRGFAVWLCLESKIDEYERGSK